MLGRALRLHEAELQRDRAGVSLVSAGTGSSCFCWMRARPQVGTQLVQGVDLSSVSKGHFSELKLQWFVLLMGA